jgi:Mg2+/Co2+ transporter CorB
MMAANRVRLRHLAQRGSAGARTALGLLAKTDRLLGVILLGNNLINAAAATLTAVLTERLFGEGKLALAAGTLAITFLILVFSEVTPKVIGAAMPIGSRRWPRSRLRAAAQIAMPAVWFVNLFVQALLVCASSRRRTPAATLSQEEIRALVLEGNQYFRGKHRRCSPTSSDLEAVTVEDVMVPRPQIHAIDLAARPQLLRQQLATSYHTRLPVYEGSPDQIVGVLHLQNVVGLMQEGEGIDPESLRPLLRKPYFVPAGTSLLTQLTQFQADRQRIGLVVDEYGELKGLVTIEDIVEEIIGEFTTTAPGAGDGFRREQDGSVTVDGMASLRTLNRHLGTRFPLDGPKTLNGLIVDHLGDIPEAGTAFRLAGQSVEVVQTQDRAVKVVRLLPPVGHPSAPLQSRDERASSSR